MKIEHFFRQCVDFYAQNLGFFDKKRVLIVHLKNFPRVCFRSGTVFL